MLNRPIHVSSFYIAIAFSLQVKTGRYRATGIVIPARIYHVELTIEVVPLCGEKV